MSAPIDRTTIPTLDDILCAVDHLVFGIHDQALNVRDRRLHLDALIERAVLPEHHAVYDARTHVTISVAEIQEWIVAAADCKAAKQWPSRGVASEYRFPWMDTDTTVTRFQPIDDWLESLIPTEATDES